MTKAVDTSTTGKHLPALDGVRGLAVLLVMVCHLWGNYFQHDSLPARLTTAGWVGVDMFFALSGFLLTGILYDSLGSRHYFRNFYARRSLRIFPLYYLYLLLTVAVGLAMGVHFYSRIWLYFTYTENLSRLSWFRSGATAASADWVTLDHFWSLAVEEHFYIVWPAVVFLLRTRRRILSAAALLAALSLAIRMYAYFSGVTAKYFIMPYIWTPTRVDTILMGAVLAMLVRSRMRRQTLAAAPYVAFAGISATLVYTVVRSLNMLTDPIVTTVGFSVVGLWAAALVACALREGRTAERVFSNGLLRFFGRYSYCVYVVHLLLAYLLVWHNQTWMLHFVRSHFAANMLTRLLVFPLSAGIAVVSFRFFEQPVLRLKRFFQDESTAPKLHRQLHQPVA